MDLHFGLFAEGRLFKCQHQIGPGVFAFLCAAAAASASAADVDAKTWLKKSPITSFRSVKAEGIEAACVVADSGMSIAIVAGALLPVNQDAVRFAWLP